MTMPDHRSEQKKVPRSACEGDGYIYCYTPGYSSEKCKACNGTGWTARERAAAATTEEKGNG